MFHASRLCVVFDSSLCGKGNISRAGSPFRFAHGLFNQSEGGFFPTEVFNNSSDSGLRKKNCNEEGKGGLHFGQIYRPQTIKCC